METVFAFETAGAQAELIHVNRLLETPKRLLDFQVLCFQGGFSYGDDIAAGSILAGQLRNHLHDTLKRFHDGDRLMLGICNGFQVMMRAGLLIPNQPDGPIATLAWNSSGRYEDRWVHLATNGSKCVFLNGIDSIYLPVAHAEGRFVCRSSDDLGRLNEAGQLALKYTTADGDQKAVGFPANPNGSMGNVAGVCDATGRGESSSRSMSCRGRRSY